MLADRPYRRVHVEALGTAIAFQRQGLATQLVEAVETWAREQGRESSAPVRISRVRSQSRFGSRGWATDAGPSSSRSVSISRGSHLASRGRHSPVGCLRQRSGMSPEQSGSFRYSAPRGGTCCDLVERRHEPRRLLCLTFRCRSIKLAAGEPWTAAAGPFPWP